MAGTTNSPHPADRRSPEPKPRLWTRGFVLLALIQTLDLFTYNMITPVIAQYATGLGCTLVMAGVVAGAFTFAALFARPASGVLADRLGRKRIVMTAVVVGCLAQVGYAFVSSYAALVALRVVHGFFYALFGTAISAMAMDSLPEARRSEGMGWFGTSYVFANALGPALGVAVSSAFGFMPMFLAGAAIAGCTLALALALPPDAPHPAARARGTEAGETRRPEAGGAKGARRGLDRFVSVRCLPLAFAACCYLTIWGIISTYIVMVGDARGVAGISLFFVVNSVTLFFTRPFAGKLADKHGLSAVFLPSVAFEVLAVVLIASSQHLWLFLVAAACKALGSGTVTPSIQAKCGELEPPERSGVAMSTYLLGTDVGYAVGPVIGGAVSAGFGFEAMFFSGLPILAVGVAAYLIWQGREKARERAAR
ncbi:MAG TPA: MFS transporter [Candidatus Aphodovivens avistercoris]|nr:MFS transporter [Candidatus Aphodovivens avistercoris]